MSDSVSNALMLDKIPLDGKAFLIIQKNHCSSFIHSLLCHSARQSRKLCLVSFNQTLTYYHNVGTRLGWNLKALQNKDQFAFVGGVNALVKGNSNQQEQSNLFKFLFETNSSPLQTLREEVQNIITKWAGSGPFTLVIDDLESLINLGVEIKDIVSFYQFCQSLIHSSSGGIGSLIVSIGLSTQADVEIKHLSSLLSHWSDLVLTERGLQTGRSKDLSGTLHVHWNIPPFTDQHYQFKCFDRGIKMFAPGTCSAVLWYDYK